MNKLTKLSLDLVPDEEKIDKRAGKLAQEFKNLVFPENYIPGSKRKVCDWNVNLNVVWM